MKPLYPLGLWLVLTLLGGCGKPAPEQKGPSDAIFACAYGDGIYVLSGDGSLKKQIIPGLYYEAALSPDKTKIAYVYEDDFHVTVFDLDKNFEVLGKPKFILNSQAVSSGNGFTGVFYPTWSLDGQRIYFLNANHLVVYDYGEQQTHVITDFPDNQSGGRRYENGNMELSKDGSTLYCQLSEGADKYAFWSINLGSNQAVSLGSGDRGSILDFQIPAELPDDAVEALFGSKENPVLGPIHSVDGRYYFYLHKKENFLSSNRVEGYDKLNKTKLDVSSL